MNVSALITRHRELVEHDETLFNDDGDLIVSPEEADASEKAALVAFNAMLAEPCLSLADVQAKADYILNGTVGERETLLDILTGPEGGNILAEDGPLVSFIRSLCEPRSEPATLEFMAAQNFEPWTHSEGEFVPPTNAEWSKIGERELPFVRIAWASMFKPKDEIVTMFRDEPDMMMRVTDDIGDTAGVFRTIGEMADLLEAAQARLLAGGAALCEEEAAQ